MFVLLTKVNPGQKLTVFGDIHGQYFDFMNMLSKGPRKFAIDRNAHVCIGHFAGTCFGLCKRFTSSLDLLSACMMYLMCLHLCMYVCMHACMHAWMGRRMDRLMDGWMGWDGMGRDGRDVCTGWMYNI